MRVFLANFVRLIAFSIGVFLSVSFSSGSSQTRFSLREIRFWTGPDHTRVVLDLGWPAKYTARSIKEPHRIVVEIPGCTAGKGIAHLEVKDGVVDRIRVNQLSGKIQVVLDLPRETEFKHFFLPASAGKPDRIVLDLVRQLSSSEMARRDMERRKSVEAQGYVVAIDPGHGGDAPGAVNKAGLKEKVLNLKAAGMLKEEIERRKGYRVVLTRDGDYDVDLYARILKAREHGADVFVSLHFNSFSDSRLRGIELYIISPEGVMDGSREALAEKEHLMQEVQEQVSELSSDLESILFDVSRTSIAQRSILLAEEVAKELRKDPPIPFRKVKQVNFIVLRGISMPSILVEGGYITNKADASVVVRDSYMRWLARSLSDGICAFLEKHPPEKVTSE